MKPLWINRMATITTGALAGTTGNVVAFDSTVDEALIQVDSITFVNIASDYLNQDAAKTNQPDIDLLKIANTIQDGYTSGDNWTLDIHIATWENLNPNDVSEIADAIVGGENEGYQPCDWALIINK